MTSSCLPDKRGQHFSLGKEIKRKVDSHICGKKKAIPPKGKYILVKDSVARIRQLLLLEKEERGTKNLVSKDVKKKLKNISLRKEEKKKAHWR